MNKNQIEQDKADVAREEGEFAVAEQELKDAKDKLAADEAAMDAEIPVPVVETIEVPVIEESPTEQVTEPVDTEAEHIAASIAANAPNAEVAAATIEQTQPDTQVSLLDELEALAVVIGGTFGEQILALSMRMRGLLAGVV